MRFVWQGKEKMVRYEEKTDNLTNEIFKLCSGENIDIVIGAVLNIVFASLSSIESPEIRTIFAHTLRDMARQIENDASEQIN